MRPGPTASGLRRLRWSLTAVFALFNLAGLAVLAFIAAETDQHSQRRAQVDEMRRRTTAVVRLLYYEGGRLHLDGLADDDTTKGVPQIVVLEGDRTVFTSRNPPFRLDQATLRRVAASAMARDDDVQTVERDLSGRRVDVLASPFYNDADGSIAGAAMAIADNGDGSGRHRELVVSLIAGCAALTAVSVAGGYLLAGRSLRPALAALEQQERFLADAAHELRNPLTALRVNLDSALGPTPDETRKLALQRAARTAERMNDLVGNLLERARVMAGAHEVRTEPLRLDQLVADLLEETPGAEHVALHAVPAVVRGDPTLLRLAVRNLVDNALRHGHRDGVAAEVTVTVEEGTVVVADRGPGLPPGHADSVFDRFRTGPGHGTGIGLAIARWVAQIHRGSVVCEPNPGGGARFRLLLGTFD